MNYTDNEEKTNNFENLSCQIIKTNLICFSILNNNLYGFKFEKKWNFTNYIKSEIKLLTENISSKKIVVKSSLSTINKIIFVTWQIEGSDSYLLFIILVIIIL